MALELLYNDNRQELQNPKTQWAESVTVYCATAGFWPGLDMFLLTVG